MGGALGNFDRVSEGNSQTEGVLTTGVWWGVIAPMPENTAKWVCITGASAGIGAATARAFAAAGGYSLLLLARREDRLRALAAELSARTEVAIANVDLLDVGAFEAWASSERSRLEGVEVLVNNAGLALGVEKFQNSDSDQNDVMLDTNVRALLRVSRRVLPGMVARGHGHIVNLGSVAGRWVYPGGAVYCASKFAVRALSEGLRLDLAGTGVRVTNIEPGMVQTEFSEVRLGSREASDRVYAGMRPLTAADVAETILWSVQRPAHVNIQELVIFPTDQAAVGHVNRKS